MKMKGQPANQSSPENWPIKIICVQYLSAENQV